MLRMGETWSRAINLKLNSKQRRKVLEQELGNQKKSKAFIRQQVQMQIWTPARHAKQILRTRHPQGMTTVEKEIIDFLSPVLSCYPANYTFEDDSIHLDAKMNPERHLMAFVTLNKCLAAAGHRCIQALPLQRSWIHRHVPMDTTILVRHILQDEYAPVTDKRPAKTAKKQAVSNDEPAAPAEQVRFTDEEYWAKVVDLKLRVFKDHPRHTFNKFITTDGVSLCVVRRTVEATLAKKVAGEKRKHNQLAKQVHAAQQAQLPAQSFPSLAQLSVQSLPSLAQSLPLLAQSIPSSAHSFPLLAQSVQLMQSFPLLAQSVQPTHSFQPPVRLPMVVPAQQAWVPMVVPAQWVWVPMVMPTQQEWVPTVTPMQQEWTLTEMPAQPSGQPVQLPAQPSDQPVKPVKWQRKKANCLYIDELSQEYLQSTVGRCVLVDPGRRDLLFAMREDSTIQKKQIYRYTKCQQRRETCVTKYRKILEQVKKADDEDIAALERTLGVGSFIKPDLTLFKEYLAARAKVATKLTVFYNKTMSWQRDGVTTPEVPLHRKLRFSVYIKRQQADDRLVKKLRAKFKPKKTDPEPIFIMGNWSAPMTQFHEPIRGKGWRRLLKRAGFEVYLIDEYLTSKLCPNCNERLSNTHYVPNPRPWRRRIQPKVKCHGLLSCESRACGEFFDTYEGKYLREKGSDVKRRLWNRDLVGVLNFRHILNSLRETGIAPARFQRGQPAEARKTKTRKTTASAAPKTTARKPRKTTAPKASTANST
ncbi:hypothetical protein GGH96_001659 [Coemansia sp. RSA 1972]|nr:hypothetical protein GGH96_001659 [Coemansia sp. RSA 1972]